MRLKFAISALLIAVLVIGGVFTYRTLTAPSGPPPGAAMPGGFAMPVEAEAVRIETAQRRIQAVGTLRSAETVMVRPEIAGRVASINFQEGQKVKKGQVLLTLDSSMEKAEVNQAQAALALARANYERADELFKKGAGTQRALDEARAKLRNDEAALQLTQARLEKFQMVAPFDGVAGLRRVSLGDYMGSGAEMVNIEQIDPLKVDFRVPELFLPAVAVGQKVLIALDTFPNRTFEGEVYALDPLIDAAGRSIVLRARLPNPEEILRPGQFARVTLTLAERYKAVFVPEQALVPQGELQFVYRVQAGSEGKSTAQMVRVLAGVRKAGLVEVLEGLKEGDMVVVAGTQKIRDGAPIAVVPPTPNPPPSAGGGAGSDAAAQAGGAKR